MRKIILIFIIGVVSLGCSAQTLLDLDYQKKGFSIGLNTDKRAMASYYIVDWCQLRVSHSVIFDSWKFQQYGLIGNFRVLGKNDTRWTVYLSPFVNSDYTLAYYNVGLGVSANYSTCKYFKLSATARYCYDSKIKHKIQYEAIALGCINDVFSLFVSYDNIPNFRYIEKSYLNVGAEVTVGGLAVKPYVRTSVLSKSDLSMAKFNIALAYTFKNCRRGVESSLK